MRTNKFGMTYTGDPYKSPLVGKGEKMDSKVSTQRSIPEADCRGIEWPQPQVSLPIVCLDTGTLNSKSLEYALYYC